MNLKTLSFIVGISVTILFSSILFIQSLPYTLDILSSFEEHEIIPIQRLSEEDQLQKFRDSQYYKVFYEKYPNATEIHEYYLDYNGFMKLGVADFEAERSLILQLHYGDQDDFISADIYCENLNKINNDMLDIDELFIISYIKTYDCLNSDIEFSSMPDIVLDYEK